MRERLLFLIGHMACGKTTLGRALHMRAGVPFIDLDAEIERAAGASVAAIFASQGEQAFRDLEAATLAATIDAHRSDGAVIACGGGTPCRPDNLRAMLDAGHVVWLRASRDVTLRRIAEAGDTRPRLSGLSAGELNAFLDREAAARDHIYARAHSTFDSSRLDTPAEIESSLNKFINIYFR